MSLAIDLDAVTRILLPSGWHEIEPGTLELDAYEFHHHDPGVADWPGAWPLRGGSEPTVPTLGFRARRKSARIPHEPTDLAGPITSLLAVEVAEHAET